MSEKTEQRTIKVFAPADPKDLVMRRFASGSIEDIQDRDWWRHVAELVGATLHGWTYRKEASFVNPSMELTGKVAARLLVQQGELRRMQERERRMRRLVVALLSLHSDSKMALDSRVFDDGVDCEIGERPGGAGVTIFYIKSDRE